MHDTPPPLLPQTFYPTEAKVKEKARRKRDKERGVEHVVARRKKLVENHYDDGGDDMSSRGPDDSGAYASWTFHSWLCLADASIHHQLADHVFAYPWTPADVAPATPGVPVPGENPRTKHHGVDCEACRLWRFRNHFTHNRIVGKRFYPP